MLPFALITMSSPPSLFTPPMYVEYSSAAPSALSSEMNPSDPPPLVACAAPAVTGKLAELVVPVIHTFPAASGATPLTPAPAMSVDQITWDAVGFSLVMKASLPLGVESNAAGVVGKSSDPVPPAT